MTRRVLGWVLTLAVVASVAAVPVRTLADDKQSATRQQSKQFDKEITIRVKLKYLLYLPEGYGKSDKAWPLLLFLHGSGESGKDLNKVKIHGPPKLIERGKDFPFIVVSPQSPRRGWDVPALNALLDDVVATHKVDKDRIYLTGLSMGGYGTWALAAAYPEKFAAIVPICGGGDLADAKQLKDLPIWVFHGAKDPAVPPRRSKEMVKALEAAGAKNVKFTLYPDADHDSWTRTYDNPKLYEWLLKQKRTGRKTARVKD
ncbi:MAG TPA: prolyl oligopeptidase family serine peptidase [Gemmataceae bacterium]|jgi:predicted peptidase|nr:prolyl oligopeptidase family serine peptidase [Gemmataceae bacterium]